MTTADLTAPETASSVTVTIFTKNNCPNCKRTKDLFDAKGIPYDAVNVEEDQTPRAEFGGLTPFDHVVQNYARQMPVVVIEDGEWGDWWSGVRFDKILETTSRVHSSRIAPTSESDQKG